MEPIEDEAESLSRRGLSRQFAGIFGCRLAPGAIVMTVIVTLGSHVRRLATIENGSYDALGSEGRNTALHKIVRSDAGTNYEEDCLTEARHELCVRQQTYRWRVEQNPIVFGRSVRHGGT